MLARADQIVSIRVSIFAYLMIILMGCAATLKMKVVDREKQAYALGTLIRTNRSSKPCIRFVPSILISVGQIGLFKFKKMARLNRSQLQVLWNPEISSLVSCVLTKYCGLRMQKMKIK